MTDSISWDRGFRGVKTPSRQNRSLKGFVYFALAGNDFVKIGITSSRDPFSRVSQMQTGCPLLIKPFFYFECNGTDPRKIESYLHMIFCDYRARGEWFYIAGKLKNMIAFFDRSSEDCFPINSAFALNRLMSDAGAL